MKSFAFLSETMCKVTFCFDEYTLLWLLSTVVFNIVICYMVFDVLQCYGSPLLQSISGILQFILNLFFSLWFTIVVCQPPLINTTK